MTAVLVSVLFGLIVWITVMWKAATAGDKPASKHVEMLRAATPYTPDPSRSQDFDLHGRPW